MNTPTQHFIDAVAGAMLPALSYLRLRCLETIPLPSVDQSTKGRSVIDLHSDVDLADVKGPWALT